MDFSEARRPSARGHRTLRRTHKLFDEALARFGVEVDFVDFNDLDLAKRSPKPNTAIVYFESPRNPTLKVHDMEAIATPAHAHDARVRVVPLKISEYRPNERGHLSSESVSRPSRCSSMNSKRASVCFFDGTVRPVLRTPVSAVLQDRAKMPIFDTPSIAQILRKVGKTMTTFLRIGLVSSVSIVLVANTSARKTTAIG